MRLGAMFGNAMGIRPRLIIARKQGVSRPDTAAAEWDIVVIPPTPKDCCGNNVLRMLQLYQSTTLVDTRHQSG